MLPHNPLPLLYWLRHTTEKFLQFVDNWIELWDDAAELG